jgi:hypothetical protein
MFESYACVGIPATGMELDVDGAKRLYKQQG